MNSRRRLLYALQRWRIIKYRLLSDHPRIYGKPLIHQPVQFVGAGRIIFHGEVNLGVFPSPYFLNGYIYIEAREKESVVEIEDGVWMNNNSVLMSAGPGIYIGKGSMLGHHCEILDSDFHELHPDRRHDGIPRTGRVVIEENVMIASNVRIMRGVRIGKNSVIANGSVVTRSIPADTLVFGNPIQGGPLISAFDKIQKHDFAQGEKKAA